MSVVSRVTRHGVKGFLRVGFKWPAAMPVPVSLLRIGLVAETKLLGVNKKTSISKMRLAGIPAERVSAPENTGRVILFMHGGGFVTGSARTHRALAGELAVRTGAEVYLPNYRLAPKHTYPAAHNDGMAAWHGLLQKGYLPENIILAGDSAGAALALDLAIALRDRSASLPAALFLLSPFVDSSLTSSALKQRKCRDPMVSRPILKRGSGGYGGTMLAGDDPRLSPVFADLHGLPPLLIQAGSEEVLHDDATLLAQRCEQVGVKVDCQIYDGMWHDFQMFTRFIAEAHTALDEIAEFVRRHSGL